MNKLTVHRHERRSYPSRVGATSREVTPGSDPPTEESLDRAEKFSKATVIGIITISAVALLFLATE